MKIIFYLSFFAALTLFAADPKAYDIASDTDSGEPAVLEEPFADHASVADFGMALLKQKNGKRKNSIEKAFSALKKDPSAEEPVFLFFSFLNKKEQLKYEKAVFALAEEHPENAALNILVSTWCIGKKQYAERRRFLLRALQHKLDQKELTSQQRKSVFTLLYMLVIFPQKPYADSEMESVLSDMLEDSRFQNSFETIQAATIYNLNHQEEASTEKPFTLGWPVRTEKEKLQDEYSVLFAKLLRSTEMLKDPAAVSRFSDFYRLLYQKNRQADAEKLLQLLLKRFPENARLCGTAADLYFMTNRFKQAEFYGKKEFELLKDKLTIKSCIRLANTLVALGKYRPAAMLLEMSIIPGMEDQYIFYSLTQIYNELHDYEKMLFFAKKMKDGNAVFLMRGIAYMQLKKYTEAFAEYQKVLSGTDPKSPLYRQAMFASALASEKMKDYKRFDELLLTYLKSYPDDPEALNTLGYTWADRNVRLDEAEKMIRKAIKCGKKPTPAEIMDSLAWVLYRRKKYQEAQSWIIKAVASSKKPSGVILDHAGDIFLKCNEPESALKFWEHALRCPDEDVDPAALRKKIKALQGKIK